MKSWVVPDSPGRSKRNNPSVGALGRRKLMTRTILAILLCSSLYWVFFKSPSSDPLAPQTSSDSVLPDRPVSVDVESLPVPSSSTTTVSTRSDPSPIPNPFAEETDEQEEPDVLMPPRQSAADHDSDEDLRIVPVVPPPRVVVPSDESPKFSIDTSSDLPIDPLDVLPIDGSLHSAHDRVTPLHPRWSPVADPEDADDPAVFHQHLCTHRNGSAAQFAMGLLHGSDFRASNFAKSLTSICLNPADVTSLADLHPSSSASSVVWLGMPADRDWRLCLLCPSMRSRRSAYSFISESNIFKWSHLSGPRHSATDHDDHDHDEDHHERDRALLDVSWDPFALTDSVCKPYRKHFRTFTDLITETRRDPKFGPAFESPIETDLGIGSTRTTVLLVSSILPDEASWLVGTLFGASSTFNSDHLVHHVSAAELLPIVFGHGLTGTLSTRAQFGNDLTRSLASGRSTFLVDDVPFFGQSVWDAFGCGPFRDESLQRVNFTVLQIRNSLPSIVDRLLSNDMYRSALVSWFRPVSTTNDDNDDSDSDSSGDANNDFRDDDFDDDDDDDVDDPRKWSSSSQSEQDLDRFVRTKSLRRLLGGRRLTPADRAIIFAINSMILDLLVQRRLPNVHFVERIAPDLATADGMLSILRSFGRHLSRTEEIVFRSRFTSANPNRGLMLLDSLSTSGGGGEKNRESLSDLTDRILDIVHRLGWNGVQLPALSDLITPIPNSDFDSYRSHELSGLKSIPPIPIPQVDDDEGDDRDAGHHGTDGVLRPDRSKSLFTPSSSGLSYVNPALSSTLFDYSLCPGPLAHLDGPQPQQRKHQPEHHLVVVAPDSELTTEMIDTVLGSIRREDTVLFSLPVDFWSPLLRRTARDGLVATFAERELAVAQLITRAITSISSGSSSSGDSVGRAGNGNKKTKTIIVHVPFFAHLWWDVFFCSFRDPLRWRMSIVAMNMSRDSETAQALTCSNPNADPDSDASSDSGDSDAIVTNPFFRIAKIIGSPTNNENIAVSNAARKIFDAHDDQRHHGSDSDASVSETRFPAVTESNVIRSFLRDQELALQLIRARFPLVSLRTFRPRSLTGARGVATLEESVGLSDTDRALAHQESARTNASLWHAATEHKCRRARELSTDEDRVFHREFDRLAGVHE